MGSFSIFTRSGQIARSRSASSQRASRGQSRSSRSGFDKAAASKMRSASNRRTRIGLERLFIASHRSSSSPLLRSTFSSTCLQEYGNHLQIASTSRRSLSFQIINCPEAECSSSRRRQFSPLKNLRCGRLFHEFFSQIRITRTPPLRSSNRSLQGTPCKLRGT